MVALAPLCIMHEKEVVVIRKFVFFCDRDFREKESGNTMEKNTTGDAFVTNETPDKLHIVPTDNTSSSHPPPMKVILLQLVCEYTGCLFTIQTNYNKVR